MPPRRGVLKSPPHAIAQRRSWIVVLGPAAAEAAGRSELRELPVADLTGAEVPAPGERVIVLALPRMLVVEAATAARVRLRPRALLHLRDRSRTPEGHAVDPFSLHPRPVCTLAWTRGGLEEMAGTFIEIAESDGARFEAAVRAAALAYGPASQRPAHDRPRTPGRRALGKGRAASGTLQGRRR